ncbi:MAG: hypothetical protein B6I17_00520 [Tenericutes bacterium 4572_104]|nr:MAG: hypothetical protein B6I17_00520 [Tenericutes bacterium 4572_104]
MKLVDYSINNFLEELASKSPAPGGGSVSALAGANAASLVQMVANLTVNKKKFKTLSENIQKLYVDETKAFKNANEQFIKYIDEDTLAFNKVMAAFKMPKTTEEEIAKRKEAIEKATIDSIKVPLEVAKLSLKMMEKMDLIIENSNKNTISDQGVSILLFHTACIGGVLNVKINLSGLSQKKLVSEYKNVIIDIENKINKLKIDLLERINNLLN